MTVILQRGTVDHASHGASSFVQASIPGVVQYVDGALLLATRRNHIYQSDDSGTSWRHVCSIPVSFKWRLSGVMQSTRRLLRAEIGYVVPLRKHQLLIVAQGAIHRFDLLQDQFVQVPIPLVGSLPLAFCCSSSPEHFFYGEYRRNPERSPTHIISSDDGGKSWHQVYQFRNIRHVHGIFHDPYTQALWITTGDRDDESAIWVTHDQFRTLHRILSGSQQVRAVHLLFTREYVYFGSDTPQEQNYLYRLSRDDHQVEQLQAVGESVFYGCMTGGWLFFSTCCEPSMANPSRHATVWGSQDGSNWQPILQFSKDRWPSRLFQNGQVRFPLGSGDSTHLWVNPIATMGHGTSYRIRLEHMRCDGHEGNHFASARMESVDCSRSN